MATPNANVATLQAYWRQANDDNDIPSAKDLALAMRAMRELVSQADEPSVRYAFFAQASIFETALIAEAPSWTTDLIVQARDSRADLVSRMWLYAADAQLRPPRLLMLDGIYKAGVGGVFSSKDPSGITSWVHSESVAGGALLGTLKGDPDPRVRASCLKIVQDLAIPAAWIGLLKTNRTFETIDQQVMTSAWPQDARRTLTALSAGAAGRVDTELAKLASGGLGTLPAFPTGDGVQVKTTPAPSVSWWRKPGASAVVGAIAAITGAAVGLRRRP